MFRTVPLSIIRSFLLFTQQWYMSYRFADILRAGSGRNSVRKPVWHIPLLCLQWKTPDDGQRNCPKHVEFYSKNKFEKLVHLVGFIIRMFVGYPSPPSHFITLLLFSHDQSNYSSASFSSTTFYEKKKCGKRREKRNNFFLNFSESFVFHLLIYSKCLYISCLYVQC